MEKKREKSLIFLSSQGKRQKFCKFILLYVRLLHSNSERKFLTQNSLWATTVSPTENTASISSLPSTSPIVENQEYWEAAVLRLRAQILDIDNLVSNLSYKTAMWPWESYLSSVYKVPLLQKKYCKGNSELVHLIQISSQYFLTIYSVSWICHS